MNTFMDTLKDLDNTVLTENGAVAKRSLNNDVYDMFATGASYRKRTTSDRIALFENAFDSDRTLALKCLFYIRDVRGGQGERLFFRECFHWLCKMYPEVARRLLNQVHEYGRWDDLIYAAADTPLWMDAVKMMLDYESKTPSLLAKWMPSENASSHETILMAKQLRTAMGMAPKTYRKTLSELRKRINIVERLMSENRWDEIEFDKIPSRAGLIYKNAFARRDIIAKKYEDFMKSDQTKVNAAVLYPYEIIAKATRISGYDSIDNVDVAALEKYWNNLPDYLQGNPAKMMCVVDTSGSMTGNLASAPINVAISLGIYCAERMGGPFHNHYISFSSRPKLIEISGDNIVQKVRKIYRTNLCENTNLKATFDLVRKAATAPGVNKDDAPDTLIVISDMQIDHMTCTGPHDNWGYCYERGWTTETAKTEMQKVRDEWAAAGLKMPRLIYWNVDARGDANIIDDGPNVSYVSGFSPTIFQAILSGKSGWDLCLEVLLSERYDPIF